MPDSEKPHPEYFAKQLVPNHETCNCGTICQFSWMLRTVRMTTIEFKIWTSMALVRSCAELEHIFIVWFTIIDV